MSKVRVVAVTPESTYIIEDFEATLSNEQKFVGGLIECVDIAPSVTLICNEEGKVNGLPINKVLRDRCGKALDVICGSCLITAYNVEGDIISLPSKMAEKYVNYINKYKSIPILFD